VSGTFLSLFLKSELHYRILKDLPEKPESYSEMF
jgi:hypothetical protein